jgi:poly-gamma-glutamate synthesis protein (capsule biosynthesis protein)
MSEFALSAAQGRARRLVPALLGRLIWMALFAVGLVALSPRPANPPEPMAKAVLRDPSIVLTGDILLAGRAGRLIADRGPQAPLAAVREVLAAADMAMGNLECALATRGQPADKEFTFRARPEAAEALREAGYDIISLANNHAADYGPKALMETLAALRARRILPVGAGRDSRDARRVLHLEAGSPRRRIAVLAFSNMLPTSFYAGAGRPGTNPVAAKGLREQVRAARRQAELVIVIFHWGEELSQFPSTNQRYLASEAVSAGADLVVGHHPHVLQGLQQRGHALIAYSLGNFLFPSHGSASHTMMLRYVAARDGSARAEIIPCVIEGFQPRLARGRERGRILAEVRALSEPLDTPIAGDGVIALPPRDRPAEGRPGAQVADPRHQGGRGASLTRPAGGRRISRKSAAGE